MAKKTALARTAKRNGNGNGSALDVIKVGERAVPVTQAIADLEATGRKQAENLAGAFHEFGKRLIDVARIMVPAFEAWCKLLDVAPRGSADLWLSRIDPRYRKEDNRTAGSYSLSAINRWRGMLAAYAADSARTQLETLAELPAGDARNAAVEALDTATRKAIAKLDLSESDDLDTTRSEIFGLPAATPATGSSGKISATDVRNGLVASILALTPPDQKIQLIEDLAKRMQLSEGAAKSFRTTGIAVKPWVVCKQVATGVRYVPPTPKESEPEAETAKKTTSRKRAAA